MAASWEKMEFRRHPIHDRHGIVRETSVRTGLQYGGWPTRQGIPVHAEKPSGCVPMI